MKIKKRVKFALVGFSVLLAVPVILCIMYATNVFTSNPVQNASKNIPVIKSNVPGISMQFVRHATLIVIADNKKILVDPMLGDIGTESPYPLTSNRVRNPLLALDIDKKSIVEGVDAVILTHVHPDHFDAAAQAMLPKNLLIFCQPEDSEFLQAKGFRNIHTIEHSAEYGKITISRFYGNHGKGALRGPMGRTSSYNISAGNNSLFITGDSLFDELLKKALFESKAKNIIAFAGAASFIIGDPITLNADDLIAISQFQPGARIYAVHMNAINHCGLTKEILRSFVAEKNISSGIMVPNEGDIISFK